ncbi:MAG: DUF5134 domain-containing protein [Propioniciclava sp.]
MFIFAESPVKVLVLLVVFGLATAWAVGEVARSRAIVDRISALLHLVMSAVMVCMVLPQTWAVLRGLLSLPGLVALFGVATAWFGFWALMSTAGHVAHAWGHAAMFGAMTWHLAGMYVRHQAMMSAGDPGPVMAVAAVGVPFMVYLLIVGLADWWRVIRPPMPPARQPERKLLPAGAGDLALRVLDAEPAPERRRRQRRERFAAAAMAGMNLGMFWMSTGLLMPVAPWLDILTV